MESGIAYLRLEDNEEEAWNAMRNTMANIWHPLGGVEISDLGEKRFLFRFYHELDIGRVEKGAP
ncbi:hypothetical protein Gohar_015694 [Gossypium harknessii]|uniref:DUF4283 domain-containing protein n=1 Tax=Gossypium harknessii TaxID=34285 RepID=A0A7J9G2R6_9ROSI|nr:hypothetical protein [Gossypium harknessii]